MALTFEQAKRLMRGDRLTFGTEYAYTVLDAFADKGHINIVLERDDGYRTFANEHMLNKASLVSVPVVENAPEPEWEDITNTLSDDEIRMIKEGNIPPVKTQRKPRKKK